jgi:hypothetical protein
VTRCRLLLDPAGPWQAHLTVVSMELQRNIGADLATQNAQLMAKLQELGETRVSTRLGGARFCLDMGAMVTCGRCKWTLEAALSCEPRACRCLQTALTDPAAVAALTDIIGTSVESVQQAVTEQLHELEERTRRFIDAAVDKGPHKCVSPVVFTTHLTRSLVFLQPRCVSHDTCLSGSLRVICQRAAQLVVTGRLAPLPLPW